MKDRNDPIVIPAVHRFREKTKQEGWIMKRTRPRDADEIRALNRVARKSFRNAL
jgi:L-lactate utilization protein LutB